MIFGILKTYKDIRSGVNDPTGFGRDIALDVFKIPLIIFTITGICALVLFFSLGWLDFLGGPFSFFRFLFFFFLLPFAALQIFLWSLFNKLKKLLEKVKKRADERMKTIDVEVR